jgi:hypothetical protein
MKTKAILNENDRYRVLWRMSNFETCCELGVKVSCVCRVSCRCPVHGDLCFGSHD